MTPPHDETWIYVIIAEHLNAIFLTLGLFAKCFGVQIRDPITVTLSYNLLVGLVLSFPEIVSFYIFSEKSSLQTTYWCCGSTLLYHFISWCSTSITRYCFIVHGDWILDRVPNNKIQCLLCFLFSHGMFLTLALLILGAFIRIGETLLQTYIFGSTNFDLYR